MAAVPSKDAPAAAKPKGKKKLVLIAAIALLVGAGGGAAAWFLQPKPAANADGTPAPEPVKAAVFLPLEVFTVNLRDAQSERFLQAGLTLEVDSDAASDKIKSNMPIARSRVLLLLSSKQSHELDKVEDKKKLGTEIIADLKLVPALKDVNIRAVHFSAFVIQ